MNSPGATLLTAPAATAIAQIPIRLKPGGIAFIAVMLAWPEAFTSNDLS